MQLKKGDKLLCIKSRDIFRKGKYYTVWELDEKDKTAKLCHESRWSGEWFWLNDSPIKDMEIDTEMFPPLKEYFATEIDVRRLKLEEIGKNENRG
jgi:hypothetical protein